MRLVPAIVLAASLVAGASLPLPPATAATGGRVVVLGFDGVDARLTEEWMAAGLLPHLDSLRERGTYTPLLPTVPAQTPVSWSSFSTGTNPGRNAIFDFLRRNPETYLPDFAMYEIGEEPVLFGRRNRYAGLLAGLLVGWLLGLLAFVRAARGRRRAALALLPALLLGGGLYWFAGKFVPIHRPTVKNTRQGKTFWQLASEHGIRSRILRVPATFPAEEIPNAEILSGLGVPDIRGTFGTFSFYTTETLHEDPDTEMGGKLEKISFVNGVAETIIYGPRNKLYDPPPDEIRLPLALRLNPDDRAVTIETSGQRETIGEREWSQWFSLAFPFNALVKARGIARFHLVSYEPFRLYLSAVNLDPRDPPFPVSHPKEYARAVASRFGLFKTLGWDLDTWALNEERIDEQIFLEDVDSTTAQQERYGAGLLGEDDDRLFVNVFQFTDRVAHMFWRTLEPGHPAYDSATAEKYRNVIRESYVRMDGIVGEAMASLRPGDVLLVCSDHGFASWKWSVNYNTWLAREGYIALEGKGGEKQKRLEDLFGRGQFWPNVNWKKTKAYSLGLGNIYINLKGREAEGTVEPGAEYERIRTELIEKLLAFTDPATGLHPVRRVFRREEIYRGYDENLIPDLFVANDNGYRVSWQTSLGGFPPHLIEPNPKKWSGDHCSLDPEVVKGVFFSSVPMSPGPAPTITDLCPTILALLEVPVPGDLDGRAIPVASAR